METGKAVIGAMNFEAASDRSPNILNRSARPTTQSVDRIND